MTQLNFEVVAKTNNNERIAIIGNDDALGSWDLKRALFLQTN